MGKIKQINPVFWIYLIPSLIFIICTVISGRYILILKLVLFLTVVYGLFAATVFYYVIVKPEKDNEPPGPYTDDEWTYLQDEPEPVKHPEYELEIN